MGARRTAIPVDGDNVSPRHAARIRAEGARLGRVDVARVYLAPTWPSNWLTVPGYRAVHSGNGKNASDLLLSIDAMDLALTCGIEAFLLASSDRGFTHLAHRLRERGLHVHGMGEDKAPETLRLACSAFTLFEADATGPVSTFDARIQGVIRQHCRNGKGMKITDLSTEMSKQHGARISATPEGSWRKYLAARPGLYEIDPRGSDAKVRVLPPG